MQRRLRMDLNVKSLYGFTENLRTIFRSISGIKLGMSQDKIPIDMFTNRYLPYEASKTYKIIVTEFQLNRMKAIVEAHRQVLCVL